MSIAAPLQLADLGWRVFPCMPGGKLPLTKGWRDAATSDADQVALWLEQNPTANWGIATDGLIVIDVDPGAEHWPENEEHASDLLTTPVIALTPRGGKHYYFRQPSGAGLRNTQNGQLAEHVDTRADGGYVAAPPSVVNGNAYRWANGDIDARPEDLPLVPRWIVDKLAAASKRPGGETPAVADSGSVPEGQRNGYLTRLAGAMRRVGADWDNIRVALLHCNAARCKPPLDAADVDTIANSVCRYAPADVRHALSYLDPDELPELERSPLDPGPLPAELLSVPGFIAEVAAYNLAGAHKPQPVLALAGALSLLATLTARKITDTQGTRTNLYCIGVAETSTGKQRAREVNKDLLYHAGLQVLIGSESIGSAQGLVTEVVANPAVLFQLDEMGRYLKTMGDAREAHLFNIVSVLMRMFTDSASLFKSDAVVDPKRIHTIYNPSPCIYGTSTVEALYGSLTVESLQDGFLSRVLVFEGDNDVAKRRITKPALPPALIEQVRYWGAFQPGGNLSPAHPQPLIIESTPAARAIMYEYDTTVQNEEKKIGPPLGALWPRGVEKANKLALLYACSENAKAPIVTDAAAFWATEVVTHLTRQLAFQAARRVSENRIERNVKRLARLIEDAGPAGMAKAGITNATEWLTARERNECLDTLIESGKIVLRQVTTTGRPRSVYTHRRFIGQHEQLGA